MGLFPVAIPSLPPYYVHVCMLSHFSCVRFHVTPWTVSCQAPLSMGFSRQEYCHGLPLSPPGDLPDPGIEPASPYLHWQGGSLPLSPPGKPPPYYSWPQFCLSGNYFRLLLLFVVLTPKQVSLFQKKGYFSWFLDSCINEIINIYSYYVFKFLRFYLKCFINLWLVFITL